MTDPNRWLPGRLAAWHAETASARTLFLDVPELAPTRAGQYVDVRLTAPDGYTAQRSYSLGTPAGARPVSITVERLTDGEVSPYLAAEMEVGDPIEVRGPIGGWFVWRPEAQPEPVQLIAGGSGIVPLMSMLRTRAAVGGPPFRLFVSARSPEAAYYRTELAALAAAPGLAVHHHYTRVAPAGHPVPPRRVTADDLAAAVLPPEAGSTVYVCGPSGFVDTVTGALTALGHDPSSVRTERFGASG